jgi:hypothetical protein
MANQDRPYGFRFAMTTHGGEPRITKMLSDGSAAIYPGDLVKKDGSGRILSITGQGDNPNGVANTYVAATADAAVYVYDDLVNTIFTAQMDGADVTDDTSNGNFFDVVVTTGDTTTLQGKQEIDSDDSADDTLLLIDKVDRVDNAWGANVECYVKVRVDANANVIATT